MAAEAHGDPARRRWRGHRRPGQRARFSTVVDVRAFVTGGTGFVGTWLRRHLSACGDAVSLLAEEIDVRNGPEVAAAVHDEAPDVIYHLAGLAHVGRSWDTPEETTAVNVLGTLSVLEAARRSARPPVVLLVSSAEVYGTGEGQPFDEEAALRPVSPYAASKAAAEFLGLQAAIGRHLPVVRVRPFNHVGPGQSPDFVVSALARRIALAELAGGGEVTVGNLTPRRDLTDVRDIVRAYRMLAETGESGAAYNVCSGTAVAVSAVVEKLCALAKSTVRIVEDPALIRPVDVPVLAGDCGRLRALTGWAPTIALEDTLADVLEYWREQLRR